MNTNHQITIVGGGLAGLSLGVGLRKRGIPTQLIEAGQYPRHRVCGEFISGVSKEALSSLGIEDMFENTPRHRSTAWYYLDNKEFVSDLPREAIGISRFRLDKDLADRFVEMGGDLQTGSRYPDTDGPAPGVVLATGRPRQKSSRWMGIKCHLLDYKMECDLEMHMGKDGYLGTSAVEDGRVDACGLFKIRPGVKAPRLELMPAYLEACGLKRMAEEVRNAKKDESSCLGVNAFELGWQSKPEEIPGQLRIGDRFAIIGPFTGNGMSMAFEGAAESVDPVAAWSKNEISWDECCEQVTKSLKKKFRTRITVSGLIHPFLTDFKKQKLMLTLGRHRLLPYATLFRVLR